MPQRQLTDEQINKLATEIIRSQSFSYETFVEAKKTIHFQQGKRTGYYIFDCLSLCFYEHTLSQSDYFSLGKQMTALLNEKDSELQKSHFEYGILFHYRLTNNNLDNAKISKRIRPDFVLSLSGKCIGLEITELTTPKDKVLNRISSQNFGQNKTVAEIKESAIERHGKKANEYQYLQIDESVSISTGMFDVFSKKQFYAKEILTKIEKYEKDKDNFDDFIVLCDAQHTNAITSQCDANDVISIVQQTNPCSGFEIAILAIEANSNKLTCYCYFI